MTSAGCTVLVVGVLFILMYRRLIPFLGVILTLALTILLTLLGGHRLSGALNAVSIGFGAIPTPWWADKGIMFQKNRSCRPNGRPQTLFWPIVGGAPPRRWGFGDLSLM